MALKEQLVQGHRAIGCWLNLYSSLAAEIVAQAGYHSVLIDMEHGPGSVMDAIRLMQATKGESCTPLLRVPANDPVVIKRCLDAGAHGLMIPAVNSRAEAEAAVSACRYPPAGSRGVAPTVIRASRYGADWQDYAARANDEILIMCQIESSVAVAAAGAIAETDGVDLLFIGPFDLSASLGHLGQPDHPEVRAQISKVESAAKSAGKLLGGIPTGERSAEALFADGYDLVLAAADFSLLRDAARANVKQLLESLPA